MCIFAAPTPVLICSVGCCWFDKEWAALFPLFGVCMLGRGDSCVGAYDFSAEVKTWSQMCAHDILFAAMTWRSPQRKFASAQELQQPPGPRKSLLSYTWLHGLAGP